MTEFEALKVFEQKFCRTRHGSQRIIFVLSVTYHDSICFVNWIDPNEPTTIREWGPTLENAYQTLEIIC